MHVLDLFSGIGGFSLGLERAGMRTVAFCEIDPFCQRILRKHWPDVPIFGDIREFAGVHADVICGGFPCQDISVAGSGAGINGSRSGLWKEFARIIGKVRPSFVIVENVSALRSRGLSRVLGDLAALGYDAEWHCIPACSIGAPHQRDRIWIVAHPHGSRPPLSGPLKSGADWREAGGVSSSSSWWAAEPSVGRVAYGIPLRVDRLRALGNSIVPQIAEIIGQTIMSTVAPASETGSQGN